MLAECSISWIYIFRTCWWNSCFSQWLWMLRACECELHAWDNFAVLTIIYVLKSVFKIYSDKVSHLCKYINDYQDIIMLDLWVYERLVIKFMKT